MKQRHGLLLGLVLGSVCHAERKAVVDESFDGLALGDMTGINAAITDGSYDAGLRLHNSILGAVVVPDPGFSSASGRAFQLTTGTNPTGGYGALSADNNPRAVSLIEGEEIVFSFDMYVQAVPTGSSGLNLIVKLNGASTFSRMFAELADATVGDVVHVAWTNPVGASEAGPATISPWISFEGNAGNFSTEGPNGNGTDLDIAQIDNLFLEVPDNSGVFHVDQASTEPAQDGSEAFPFKTISQAAAAMAEGDTCIIHAGTYRERVEIAVNNVTFKRYRDDEVIVAGCDLVTGWTLHTNNIYRAPLAGIETEFTQVFYHGDHQQIARWPDNISGDMLRVDEASGYADCETFNDTGTTRRVAFPGMVAVPDNFWQGGVYRGITGRTRSNTMGDIQSSSGNDLVCIPLSNAWKDDATNNEWFMGGGAKGYILHLNALSTEGEWWHEGGQLYFWQPGGGMPDATSVEAQVRREAFSIVNRTGVVLEGIQIKAATVTVDNSDSCRFENCSFEYVHPYMKPAGYGSDYSSVGGVFIDGDNNVVDSCYFNGSWGHLLYLNSGNGNEVRNSVFQNNGWYSIFSSCVHIAGAADTLIEYCTFGSTGRFHVRMDSSAKNTIRYCDFFDCMNMGQDAGSIESVGQNLMDSEFAYNSIHDSDTIKVINTGGKQYVVAFYIEDTSNYTAHHNVVWNFNNDEIPDHIVDGTFCYLGPRVTTQGGIRYYNNTVWDCDYRIRIWNRDGLGAISTEFWNNLYDSSMLDGFGTPSLESGFDFQNSAYVAPNEADASFQRADAGNFALLAGAAAIDAGKVIPGVTDGFSGSAPDAGAIESGSFMWRTGASITNNLRQKPFGGIRQTIPDAKIWAAHYDEGGIGIAYHDLTMGNSGGICRNDSVDLVASPAGAAIGSTAGGEWLEYSVDVVPGPYEMKLTASAADSNRLIRVQLDGTDLAAVPITYTGGLDAYETFSANVVVNGTSTSRLRVCFDTGGTHLESIEFSPLPVRDETFFHIADSSVVMGVTNGSANSWFAVYSKTNLLDGSWTARQRGLKINASGYGAFTNAAILGQEFFQLMQSGAPVGE